MVLFFALVMFFVQDLANLQDQVDTTDGTIVQTTTQPTGVPSLPNIQISTLYVSHNGSDSNNGTKLYPFATIKKAAAVAKAGQTILIAPGTYTESYIRFTNNGIANRPIVVMGDPSGEVKITSGSGAKWIFDFTDEMGGTKINSYITFKNLKVYGSRHAWRFSFNGLSSNKPQHITIEDCEGWDCASVIGTRRSGVGFLTVRRGDFHGCTGSEGGIDLGNNTDDWDTPQSGSHDVLLEDCLFHDNNITQQCNGIVTQASTYNVTLIRCKSWNNAKYGFGLKGSGNFKLYNCESWGNGSSQFYLRGMAYGDPANRTAWALNDFELYDCIGIGPKDSSGAILVWREAANVKAVRCVFISPRDTSLTTSGWPLASTTDPDMPNEVITLQMEDSLLATLDGEIIWFQVWRPGARIYDGTSNTYWRYNTVATGALFRLTTQQIKTLPAWKAAMPSDVLPAMQIPTYVLPSRENIPLAKNWPTDWRTIVTVKKK